MICFVCGSKNIERAESFDKGYGKTKIIEDVQCQECMSCYKIIREKNHRVIKRIFYFKSDQFMGTREQIISEIQDIQPYQSLRDR